MANNGDFAGTVGALFKGMEEFVTTKTVVGEPVHVNDTIILPLVEVTFGCAATTKNDNPKHNAGGGRGGKMTPSAVLVIQGDSTRLVNIKNQDAVNKVIDMMPDLVNRFVPGLGKNSKTSPDVDEAIHEVKKKQETFESES